MKELDTSSIHGRMSGSPRRVSQEMEIEVTLRHVVKLQVTSPLTEQMAVREAEHQVQRGIANGDPVYLLKGKIKSIKHLNQER